MKVVEVNAKFNNTYDSNVDLFTLTVEVKYRINDSIGFTNTKRIDDIIIIENVTSEEWVSYMKQNLTKRQAKELIQLAVINDIKDRLFLIVEQDSMESMQMIMNMLNQMDFNFKFDLDEAEEDAKNVENDLLKLTPTTSVTEPCTVCE